MRLVWLRASQPQPYKEQSNENKGDLKWINHKQADFFTFIFIHYRHNPFGLETCLIAGCGFRKENRPIMGGLMDCVELDLNG